MTQDEVTKKRRQRQRDGARIPPNNPQAEESLLGAMLLSKAAIPEAIEVHLDAEDFYRPAHGNIFDAIMSLYALGQPVDPVTVADVLERADVLEAVGGASVLISLQAGTPAISNAGRYAVIVKEMAQLRQLIRVASDIAEIGYSTPTDVTAAVDEAEAAIFAIAEQRVTETTRPLRDIIGPYLDRLDVLYRQDATVTGVPTGFIDLDAKMAGLQPSNLIIVGGRPGTGKTSFALNIASNAAFNGIPVLIFSLEMGNEELTQRLLSAEARVDSTRLRNGRLTDNDWPKITAAIGRLAEADIWIDDNAHATVMDIRAKARRMKARTGLGLVVVDYVQLMSGRSSAENRQVEISEISRGLKILARELQVPVIALSQLSRNLESRADKRPVLADLRESGSLEQDADVVIFLYRDEIYNRSSPDRGTAEIILAKHRSGPTGVTSLAFLDHYTRFANMAKGV